MTKIKSPTGFVSTPKTAQKSATTGGKPAGAPELKKALKRPGDSFEQAPKAGKDGLKANDRVIVKVIADEPTTPVKGGGDSGLKIDDHIVKVIADEPTNPIKGGGDIGFKGDVGGAKGDFRDDIGFKGNIGGKGDFKDVGFPRGPIKVIADEPTNPVKGGGDSKIKDIDDGVIVKVIADEPTNPIKGGGDSKIKDIDDGVIVKVIADEPTNPVKGGGNLEGVLKVRMDTPDLVGGSAKPPERKPLEGNVLKVRMDTPDLVGGKAKPPELKPLEGNVLKVRMDSPF